MSYFLDFFKSYILVEVDFDHCVSDHSDFFFGKEAESFSLNLRENIFLRKNGYIQLFLDLTKF